jgi:hypothetical protein
MPGLDRRIDPITGDYVHDGDGATETTRSALPQVYHQLRLGKRTWFGDPDAGIDRARYERRANSRRTELAYDDALKEALAPLVAEGSISRPQTRHQRESGGRLVHEATATDLQTGDQLDLTRLVPLNP